MYGFIVFSIGTLFDVNDTPNNYIRLDAWYVAIASIINP